MLLVVCLYNLPLSCREESALKFTHSGAQRCNKTKETCCPLRQGGASAYFVLFPVTRLKARHRGLLNGPFIYHFVMSASLHDDTDAAKAIVALSARGAPFEATVPDHLVCAEKEEVLHHTPDSTDIEHVEVEDDPRQWSRFRKVSACAHPLGLLIYAVLPIVVCVGYNFCSLNDHRAGRKYLQSCAVISGGCLIEVANELCERTYSRHCTD